MGQQSCCRLATHGSIYLQQGQMGASCVDDGVG
jgi:hypothetical protein